MLDCLGIRTLSDCNKGTTEANLVTLSKLGLIPITLILPPKILYLASIVDHLLYLRLI